LLKLIRVGIRSFAGDAFVDIGLEVGVVADARVVVRAGV
jgi:hypothetical protein